jgi:hypothetical protein
VTAPGTFDPRSFVENAPWRFAKAMPELPHEYVVEGKVADQHAFDRMVALIAADG